MGSVENVLRLGESGEKRGSPSLAGPSGESLTARDGARLRGELVDAE
jgi:hypothetical protein